MIRTRILEHDDMHDQRGIGRSVTRMNLSHPRRAYRNRARRRMGCARSRRATRNRYPRSRRSASTRRAQQSTALHSRRHMAHGLDDSFQDVDFVSADGNQQRERGGDIHSPENTPPHATAPGSIFCGSLISSPITDASSSPTSPKQITPKELSMKRGFAGIRKSAAVTVVPKLQPHHQTPKPIRTAAATPVPMPPILLIHFPTPSPTMFSTTSSNQQTSEAITAKYAIVRQRLVSGPSTTRTRPRNTASR